MPFYEVFHSFPLTVAQKEAFAVKVTELHTRAFKAPSLFVNVVFRANDVAEGDYYVAGTFQRTVTNRIWASVRTSAARTKEHFDALGTDIEKAWYEVLADEADVQGKQLVLIAFIPAISGRELGFLLPLAGEEKAWVKQARGEFERRAKDGDKLFQAMLDEIAERDDLVDWRN